MVNVGTEPYEGKLLVSNPGPWLALDPATGAVQRVEQEDPGNVALALPARQTRILVTSIGEK